MCRPGLWRTDHVHLVTGRAVLVQLVRVQAPGNAVELDIGLVHLEELIDVEQVEPLNFVRADVGELPLPEDLVASGDEDIVGRDVGVGGAVEDALDPLRFGAGRQAAELETLHVNGDAHAVPLETTRRGRGRVWGSWGNVQETSPGSESSRRPQCNHRRSTTGLSHWGSCRCSPGARGC